ncbi:cation-transporting P-type ATPase [Citricoccus sp. SGAir0253]|uniref:cation-translocating P-type ATPase n=1 Tax=Citricoccus sp. SGAir0253 TaxID=2567881 RepID=UPI001FEF0100|nr:cation-transporting P-type ATPase [Citricoccus sp. SGAir0253]
MPGTETRGLSTAEARRVQAETGRNELPRVRQVPAWRRFAGQFTHFFALLLWGAAVLALVAGMPQLAVAVVAVVVVNGIFAFAQEERAAHAAARLRELLPTQVAVVRDGRTVRVDAAEIVPGDVVVLTAGDRLPADARFVETDTCTVDESMLTGESEPVPKTPGDDGFGGTFLANGDARAEVTATGARTRLAAIASLTAEVQPPPTPLQRELRRIVRILSAVALGLGVAFCLVSIAIGTPLRDAFLFAIGVAVAMIPEGLLPTVTLSLAMGAQRMAGRNALVRNLQAVETLGSTTFICTDKTGTLTQNRMNVVEVWTPEGGVGLDGEGYSPEGTAEGPPAALARAALTAWAGRAASRGRIHRHDAGRHPGGEGAGPAGSAVEGVGAEGGDPADWVAEGDPMEAALDAAAHRLAPYAAGAASGRDAGVGAGPTGATARERHGTPPALAEPAVARRYAFDPARRRESVVVGDELLVKGAPESVLARCRDRALAEQAHAAVVGMAARGLRVLAVARRDLAPGAPSTAPSTTPDELETGLELLGLVGLQDPPRDGVPGALRQAREAGIRVAMITGDHPATAAAIARQTGLALGEPVVIEGRDLPADEAALGELVDRDGVVVSRVSPEQKLAIARALQRRGHVLAMTGDGVNDGPALNEADIGVAMGASGTDVAREAADLVLLDDDFSTIIAAVEQGRATYTNIRRFLTYHLTDNVAELTPFVVWALSGGNVPLALGVLQVLALDIGTDLLPALALGAERPGKDVLRRPPERRHLLDGALLVRVFGVLGPVQAVFEMGAFAAVLWGGGWRWGQVPEPALVALASGAAFTTVVLAQMANAFGCRSATRPAWRLGWGDNRMLLWAVAAELVLLLGFLFPGPLAAALGHAPPPPAGLAVALAAVPAVLLADGIHKRVRHHRTGAGASGAGRAGRRSAVRERS